MKKILWLDTETTGLDAQKHGIIQLAVLMDIDGKVEGELLLDVQPFDSDVLNINNVEFEYEDIAFIDKIKPEDIVEPSNIKIIDIVKNHKAPKSAYMSIISFLGNHILKFDKTDKAYLGGYNVNFDRNFISEFFKKNNDNYLGSYLSWRCLDPLYRLWEMDYKGYIALENYKLETVCNHFGIPISAHNAMSDIKATMDLWYRLESGND
ncbi:MAG: 3'-5' exonuclease [Paludibacter sp.]|nr:3'-5' exonuclease [Paludibacter sp.]